MSPSFLFYVDDRGFHRSSTMPGVIKNDEITNESTGPSNLERSRTERRRQNNPAIDPAKQLLDERIPIKKKVHIITIEHQIWHLDGRTIQPYGLDGPRE
jgi:hypothetical protein